jgi:hypothetical protein
MGNKRKSYSMTSGKSKKQETHIHKMTERFGKISNRKYFRKKNNLIIEIPKETVSEQFASNNSEILSKIIFFLILIMNYATFIKAKRCLKFRPIISKMNQ